MARKVKGQISIGGKPVFKQSMVARKSPHTIYALQPAGPDDFLSGTPLYHKTKHGTLRVWRR